MIDAEPSPNGQFRTFGGLLRWHLDIGTRPNGESKKWEIKEFAFEVDVSSTAVRNWINDVNLPVNIGIIEIVLFGKILSDYKEEYKLFAEQLRTSYRKSDEIKKRRVAQDDTAGVLQDIWLNITRNIRTDGLVELTLDEPLRRNDLCEAYYLRGSIRIGVMQREYNDQFIYIGLVRAFLTVKCIGYRVVDNSLIGDRAVNSNFSSAVGGSEVIGPKSSDFEVLEGNPLRDDYLAVIKLAHNEDIKENVSNSATAALHTFSKNGFQVWNENKETSAMKAAILNTFIYVHHQDSQGRVLLAMDKIVRKNR